MKRNLTQTIDFCWLSHVLDLLLASRLRVKLSLGNFTFVSLLSNNVQIIEHRRLLTTSPTLVLCGLTATCVYAMTVVAYGGLPHVHADIDLKLEGYQGAALTHMNNGTLKEIIASPFQQAIKQVSHRTQTLPHMCFCAAQQIHNFVKQAPAV